jgi:fatty-acyl-CoA synthase
MFNCEVQPGAVGRIPAFLSRRFSATIAKFDTENDAPFRDERGFCVQCHPEEAGEVIGKITRDHANYSGRFEGYTSDDQTERKILRNVFEHGDAWFRTGDLMRNDRKGYFYFVDRIGDAFRRKGENVATYQVSSVIMSFPGIVDATIYG